MLLNRFLSGFFLLATLDLTLGQELSIRIDSNRNGAVYYQAVDSSDGFKLVSQGTPAKIKVAPGQRIDVLVIAQEGWFHQWRGSRQNIAGPCSITVRLERGWDWQRVAGASIFAFFSALLVLVSWRLKVRKNQLQALEKMSELNQRVADAERVGALARTLGTYRVLEKLGAGAMGVVYKVEDPQGTIFAAKVPNVMDERVLREAQASSTLESPYIARCFGIIEAEPSFLLLEYLSGLTLRQWLEEQGQASLTDIDQIITQLLQGLQTAHAAGVIHRDLKPDNLFIQKTSGRLSLKIMDFGLATLADSARLTRTGEAMGTPVYASPEQLSGNAIDARTDLYSVGVLIFELATGKLPWLQTDPVALIVAKHKPLPSEPISHRSEFPSAWNTLALEMLQANPEDRPAQALVALQRWQKA